MIEHKSKIITGNGSRTGLLLIPSDIMIDSQFPFKRMPATVKITIYGSKLIVETAEVET